MSGVLATAAVVYAGTAFLVARELRSREAARRARTARVKRMIETERMRETYKGGAR